MVLLEAGGPWDNTTDSAMLTWPFNSPRRGASTRERPFGEFDACIGGWNLPGEPFTVAPGSQFDWWRARMLGGRTNHWGRISLRFGPDDFRRKSLDGLGDDWPICYDDLAPYYDQVDDLIGIFGSAEGLPNDPDGIFLPPPKPRCYELLVKQACRQAQGDLHPVAALDPDPAARRSAGLPLLRPVQSRLHGQRELLVPRRAPAAGPGHRQAHPHHQRDGPRGHDRRRTGSATAWSYIDKATGNDQQVRREDRGARGERLRVGAAAAQLEESPIPARTGQLERRGRQVPDRYHRHRRGGLHSRLGTAFPHNEDGVGGAHLYMPWWLRQQDARLPARLPHRDLGRPGPAVVRLHGRHRELPGGGGYGKALKDAYRRLLRRHHRLHAAAAR